MSRALSIDTMAARNALAHAKSHSPIRARFRPTNSVAKCTDQESSRYALSAVQIVPVIDRTMVETGKDADGKPVFNEMPKPEVYAVATDSRCLAITKMPGLAAESVLCPGKSAVPATCGKVNLVELNGEWRSTSFKRKTMERTAAMADEVEGRFPAVADVIPRSFSNSFAVRLDARILARLADALTSDESAGCVTLIFSTKDGTTEDPIGVLGNAGFGVLMPLRCEGEDTSEAAFVQHSKTFAANLKAENTPERQAEVLAILNPQSN